MNTIKYLLFIFTALISTSIHAQSEDQILIRIDGNKKIITKSDFEYALKKDINNSQNKQQSIAEFLQSYINYQLNIEDAKQQGINKETSFIKEYSSYIEQIEKPYLTDSISPIIVAKNIYNKLNENIEVSHILIKIPDGYILPKDTLDAYKKASYILKLANKKDASSFESLASEYSEDSISKYSRIPGYLNWKTSLSGPLKFEEAMYTTPIGSISKPIRSSMGYHLIKVHNKRSDRGQINLAHILLKYPQQNATQEEKDSIANLSNKIYSELIAGANFDELCAKYSSDPQTAGRGGNLGWYGVNRPLPAVFDSTLFSIDKIGMITTPIEANYGYHIFKLLDKLPLSSFEDIEKSLVKAISGSDRKQLITDEKIKRLAEKYPYKIDKKTYHQLEKIADTYIFSDSTFREKVEALNELPLLSIGNSTYNTNDFLYYVEKDPYSDYTLSTDILAEKTGDFILDRLTETERNSLLIKHPEYRHLATEYYDGILYFNIMSKEVWDKAQNDRLSLQNLFDNNRSKYTWPSPKYKGYVIHAKDKNAIKKIEAVVKENKNTENLKAILEKAYGSDFTRNIIVEKGLWAKGENSYIDQVLYKKSNNEEIIDYPEFIIEGKLISAPEKLEDIYGEVVADYQDILEKEWMEYLHNKHKVQIDEDVLKTINLGNNE